MAFIERDEDYAASQIIEVLAITLLNIVKCHI